MGDAICQQILEKGSDDLAELTWAAEKHFKGSFSVVMTGGILAAFPEYAEMVIKKASKRAVMIKATAPPVYGALVEACHQQGITLDDTARANFTETYRYAPVTGA